MGIMGFIASSIVCAYGDCIIFLKSNNSDILNSNRPSSSFTRYRGLRLEKLSAYFTAVKCCTHNLFDFAVALSLGTNYDKFPMSNQLYVTVGD
jgi:hypothetical protein